MLVQLLYHIQAVILGHGRGQFLFEENISLLLAKQSLLAVFERLKSSLLPA